MREFFDLVDADRSGAIDERELHAAMCALGLRPEPGGTREVLAGADVNGDGEVEFDEFLELMARKLHSKDSQEDELVQVFQLISGTVGWAPLLFDEDIGLSFQSMRRTVEALGARFPGEDLHRLLVQGSPTGGALSEKALGQPSLSMRTAPPGRGAPSLLLPPAAAGAAAAPPRTVVALGSAWHREERGPPPQPLAPIVRGTSRLRDVFPRMLAEVCVALMRWPWASKTIARALRWQLVAWVLTPIFSRSFLMALFRHRRAKDALCTLLRAPQAARGVAQLLRHHEVLSRICAEPDAAACVAPYIGEYGLGKFVRDFLVAADKPQLASFLRHSSTAKLIATMVVRTEPSQAAALVNVRRAPLAHAIASTCQEPEMDLWGTRFARCEGIDRWIGAFVNDPRGAAFARRVLLSQGFVDWVENFLKEAEARTFVIRLLQQPGVIRFVTWLNRDAAMCRWFANIASRDSAMEFITEMLLEPGLDRFMVSMLLRPGNDAALRAMLEHWVRAEQSLGKVVDAFAQKPDAARSLAKVIVSPGFLDRFVFRRLLLQPGLAEVVVEAVILVGVRGLQETVLPLALSTAAMVITFSALSARPDLETELASLLEEMQGLDSLLSWAPLMLGVVP